MCRSEFNRALLRGQAGEEDLAEAMAHSELVVVEGLGHGLAYPALWEEMIHAIARVTG